MPLPLASCLPLPYLSLTVCGIRPLLLYIYRRPHTDRQLQTPLIDRKATLLLLHPGPTLHESEEPKHSASSLLRVVALLARWVDHGVEGQLLGPGAHPAQPAPPHGVPRLAVARGPPPPAAHGRRHQRRRAPPLGHRHDEGQRQERGDGGAVGAERDHGFHADGDDGDPLLHGRRRGAQQHLHHQEAAERHRVRRARRVHDGAQVRGAHAALPLRLPLPLPRHLLPQPGQLPDQHLGVPLLRRHRLRLRRRRRRTPAAAHQGLHRRRPGARVHAQPRRQQALLRRRAAPALDLRPAPRVPVLHGHDPHTLQPRRRQPQQGPQRLRRQRQICRDERRRRLHACCLIEQAIVVQAD